MERPADSTPSRRPSGARWAREGTGLEFDRVAFFTDAVFAIAMTLLVVAIAVPALRDTTSSSDLLGALNDKGVEFLAFFIGFVVLGFYWLANHRFFANLTAVSDGYIMWVVVYLAFVAWLPFPTALLGTYEGNPVAVGLFAASAAVVSTLESMLLRQAHRDKLFRNDVPRDAYIHAMRTSLMPVVFFALSIPVAFLNTHAAVVIWALSIPAQAVLDRYKPASFDDAFDVTARPRQPS